MVTTLLLLAIVSPCRSSADDRQGAETAYAKSASAWHATWRTRPHLLSRDEESCVEAWQTGDKVRQQALSVSPPERFAAYHEALLTCMAACLKVSDECLLKPRGGPKFTKYLLSAQKTCREVSRTAKQGDLPVPRNWF